MSDTVSMIRKEVIARCKSRDNMHGYGAWTYHIKSVADCAVKLAEAWGGVDVEVVELAALLHDVASVTKEEYVKEHHIYGAEIAEQLLTDYNYPEDKIELIKKCILNHRGSRPRSKVTIEEIIIADADAMAHFDNIPSLFSLVYKERQMSIDDGARFVKEKLQRSYDKLSDNSKRLYRRRYDEAMSIFGNLEKQP